MNQECFQATNELRQLWSFTGKRITCAAHISILFNEKFAAEKFSVIRIRGSKHNMPLFWKDGVTYAVRTNGECVPVKELKNHFVRDMVSIRRFVRESFLTYPQLITVYKNHQKPTDRKNVQSINENCSCKRIVSPRPQEKRYQSDALEMRRNSDREMAIFKIEKRPIRHFRAVKIRRYRDHGHISTQKSRISAA